MFAGPGREWMWSHLRDSYQYVTLKTEDMCHKHSGLLQSLGFSERSNITDHTFLDLFCHPKINRPNCIGDRYLHHLMLDYMEQFIENYHRVPWAIFSNFGEAHEDSVALGGILDDDLYVQF